MTLGSCSRQQIAARLALPQQTVVTAELLFLDIRDLHEAPSWIHTHVIRPEERQGQRAWSTRYRAAYWGGPVAAVTLLDAEERIALDLVERIADQETRLHLKVREALDMPLDTTRDALKFLKIHFDCEHQKKYLKFQKKKFRRRCQEDQCKHELAERRIEAQGERMRARAEQSAQAQRERAQGRAQQREILKQQTNLYAEALRASQLNDAAAARQRGNRSALAQLTWQKNPDVKPAAANTLPSPQQSGQVSAARATPAETSESDLPQAAA